MKRHNMKIKITSTQTKVYEYDLGSEIFRLKKCFKGKQLERQMDILQAVFVQKDMKRFEELYYALPYCEKYGCSEMEYVGDWINIVIEGAHECFDLVSRDYKIEYERLEKLL